MSTLSDRASNMPELAEEASTSELLAPPTVLESRLKKGRAKIGLVPLVPLLLANWFSTFLPSPRISISSPKVWQVSSQTPKSSRPPLVIVRLTSSSPTRIEVPG